MPDPIDFEVEGATTTGYLALIILAVVLALIALTDGSGAHEAEGTTDRTTPPIVIFDDDPRWDCETMGNHTCGG